TLRIPREIYQRLLADLRRPHPFAAERVAFAQTVVGNRHHDTRLVLVTGWWSIPDNEYIDDPCSGARIGTAAIRHAMQTIIDVGRGVIHVHLHDLAGAADFGEMDRAEIPRLVKSFQHVDGDLAHGMLVLSPDGARALMKTPSADELRLVDQITIVGWPITV